MIHQLKSTIYDLKSSLNQLAIGLHQRLNATLLRLPLLRHQGFRTITLTTLLISSGLILAITTQAALTKEEKPCPNEQPITIPGVEKKLIQMGPSRSGLCVVVQGIVMHNTAGGTLDSNWDLFNENQRGGGQNAQFIVGEDGKIYQTVEFYQTQAELAWTSNYANAWSVGIEMVGEYTHDSKSDQPPAQYNAVLNLVCSLMKQYNIPVGSTEADWINHAEDPEDPNLVPGVYGHYQIHPSDKEDPGQGWMTDFRADLKAGNCGSTSTSTGGPAGRVVPYDRYARPYSWPISGVIKQNYGFTQEAQSLGQRFPGLYPIGDPNAIFSTTNHTEPPLDPNKSKYINPNIDISPVDNSTQARAVYSTHAGWITYADWAGPQKGYTIQVESDVDGDGQADLATRYMRLQAPQQGYFAPDIALFKPAAAGGSPTVNGTCTAPANNDWANVNRWDEQVKRAIATIKGVENIEVPCNLVKAFMYLESGGIELEPNADGYGGLMQVAGPGATGGGSDCNWQQYDVNTTEGNLNCGVQEIARGYLACGNYTDAMSKYFSGQCTGADDRSDAFGTTVSEYKARVNELWQYLDSSVAQAAPPAIDDKPNPTEDTPVKPEIQTPPIQTVEAEDMSIQNNSDQAKIVDDSAASASRAVHFTGPASLAKSVELKADQIGVVAKATKGLFCSDDAEIIISNAGQELGRITVTSNIYKTYYFNPQGLDGSQHNLTLRFANSNFLLCQRQVWIDSVNYIVLNPHTPTVTTTSDVIIEAENLPDATEGDDKPSIKTDNQASQDKYVLFEKNGKLESPDLEIPDSNYITVRARADTCTENVPHISVKLDGTEVLSLGINRQVWTEFSADLKMPTSTAPTTPAPDDDQQPAPTPQHTLTVEYDNDNSDEENILCDMTVYLDYIQFLKYDTNQSTATETSLIGKTKYVGYNQLIGYVASSRGTDAERPEYRYDQELYQDPQDYNITIGQIPNPSQAYLSYRIMYNNPNFTTFPQPDQGDAFINAKVDDPYIVETDDNKIAGNLKTVFDQPNSPMFFFCALRTTGNNVKCINRPNP